MGEESVNFLAPMVDDAFLLSEAGARMCIRNAIVRHTMSRGGSLSREAVRRLVREVIRDLARERRAESDRLASAIAAASGREGYGRNRHDYRAVDIPGLRARRDVESRLAARLESAASDPVYVDGQLSLALSSALEDLVRHRIEPTAAARGDALHVDRASRMVRKDLRRAGRRFAVRRRILAVWSKVTCGRSLRAGSARNTALAREVGDGAEPTD
ncbi:hypothetical protein [Microbacterium rhizosphaerae]|uniref:DUF222 domain-containing protein n=1 Tax=Microbacterium rhizosphaerae TaxID=1678237 RepID=A0ABZ0SJU2_9MICO|nr:hypothetical protein [Microbacterium rhizosphaerae]WPR89363.1 hypothetical protein SM116_16620 [Microbacterium rhizosphaerae]